MLRKFFVGLVSFVFVVLFFSISLVFGLFNTFFNPDFYDEDFVDLVYEFSLNEVVENSDIEGQGVFTKDDLRVVLEESLDKETLYVLVDDFVDQIENNVANEDSVIEFTVPLDWVSDKNYLITDAVSDRLYDTLNICEYENGDYSVDFDCIPDGLSKDQYKEQVRWNLEKTIFSEIPDDFVFAVGLPSNYDGSLYDFINDFAHLFFLLCLVALLFILLILGVIVFRPFWKVLKTEFRTVFVAAFFPVFFMGILVLLINSFSVNSYSYIASFFIGALFNNLIVYLLPVLVVSLAGWIFTKYKTISNGS